MADKRLLIFDGNALIHRSFHALPTTIKNKKGEILNAVFGFANVLLKSIKEFKPDYVVLTLDRKGPTFRHKVYGAYKAQRVKAPNELYQQIPRVKELAQVFGIPIFEKDGFEADDIIGTISKIKMDDIEKIIVTGDMDTLQLVSDEKKVKVYTMSRGLSDSIFYDEVRIKEKYGLSADQVVDYKALRGDPSDNIPGVKGIGEKMAVELLAEFNSLENIYKNLNSEKIKERTRELLLNSKEEAFLSQNLATIKCDVEIDFSLAETEFGDFDKNKVIELLSELEFKSLVPRLQEMKIGKIGEVVDKFERDRSLFKYQFIVSDQEFTDFLVQLKKQKEFVFDTETSSLDPITTEILGISFAWNLNEAYYVKINTSNEVKNVADAISQSQSANLFNYQKKDEVRTSSVRLEALRSIFADEKIKKNGHNIKFDLRVLSQKGLEVRGINFDSMIASYLLNPGNRQYSLDAVSFNEFGFEKISTEDLLGKGKNKLSSYSQVEDEKLAIYSCEDADFTNKIVNKLRNKLKEDQQEDLFYKIEMPLVEVLANIEDNGIKINSDFLHIGGVEADKKIKNLEKNIYELAGQEFNVNSIKQLKEILFDKLKINTTGIKKGKTGWSTSAEELDKLKNAHPIISLIQEHRELRKLQTTYIEALPKLVNPKTGRVHSSFNQTITATGRLSSTDPNLQNIPVRTELGKEIRRAFVAEDGWELLALDYSQIELRLAAHFSSDEKMIKAFQAGEDIHTATASQINQVALKDVTREMRREAKAINFGVLYGQGSFGLSQGADIPLAEAKKFIEKYFTVYSGVKNYIDNTIIKARKDGFVETLFGRRRYLPEINSSIPMVKKGAERMAVNTPLQGTAADIIKLAMIEIYRLFKDDVNIKMILQVHDELIFEVRPDKLNEYYKRLKEIMEGVTTLKVPLIVEAKSGKNWGEMEKI